MVEQINHFQQTVGPAGALLIPLVAGFLGDVRPEAWDDQDIIRVDYLPLKRLILTEPVKRQLRAIAEKPSTTAGRRGTNVVRMFGSVWANALPRLDTSSNTRSGMRNFLGDLPEPAAGAPTGPPGRPGAPPGAGRRTGSSGWRRSAR